jgi:hypothetical protein
MIALLAAVALTLAYPMSARRSTHAGNVQGVKTADRAVKVAEQADPQLRFSMRTVVRPDGNAQKLSDSKTPVHAADAAPKFEGYVNQPTAR